jgi:hypothetical protein
MRKPRENKIVGEGAWRFDKHGKITCLAFAQNYVMARRPNAMPFVMSLDEWLSLPPVELGAQHEAKR